MNQSQQILLAQQHELQSQLLECTKAFEEVSGCEECFKVVGSVMIKSEPSVMKTELAQKKAIIESKLRELQDQLNGQQDNQVENNQIQNKDQSKGEKHE